MKITDFELKHKLDAWKVEIEDGIELVNFVVIEEWEEGTEEETVKIFDSNHVPVTEGKYYDLIMEELEKVQ